MTGQAAPVVEVRDAFCLYQVPDGAVVALRGLTLGVAAGERVVVHGPNGSGKSTLLRLLAGDQQLAAGRARVAGAEVGTASRGGWQARTLGWVDQNPWRMLRPELDVLGNVLLQQRLLGIEPDRARQAGEALLTRLGVEHLARRRPATLSGGEAQRVAMCAALAHGPRLLLADEPTGELDAVTALEVYDALADAVASTGAALVLVSHDQRAARVADRVVRIRDGRLSETWQPVADGSAPRELLVVDDRGWVRLPDSLRAGHDVGGLTLRSEAAPDGSMVLRPSGFEDTATPRAEVPQASAGRTVTPTAPIVADLTGVVRRYGERTVLNRIDLEVRAGRLLVVRGPSGTGKSTLLRVLLGLEPVDEGRIRLDGVELADLDRTGAAALRRRLASYCGQDVQLADTSDAVTNLDLARSVRGLPADDAVITSCLERLALTPLAARLAGELSGGERQRLAVARALAVSARLLICDEPTSQLDEASAQSMATVLVDEAARGAAVVVATHDPVLIDAADVVLDLG